MSRGGQNRKTKQQAELDGTYRADRHVAPLELAPGDVVIPSTLAGRSSELWNEYVAPRLGLGVYEPAEAPLLAVWCIVLARLEAVNAVTPFEGIVEIDLEDGRTAWVKHPGMSVFKQLAEELRAISARLGMDPLSRLALGDLQRERDGGPSLPDDAPPAWTPTVLPGRAARALKPRCSTHARRWRKSCDECQQVRAREGLA
jgi:phage terminase small subunit